MAAALAPGWYPAPGSPGALRWWDGIRWTGETREADQPASAPGAGEETPDLGQAVSGWSIPDASAWSTPDAWSAPAAPLNATDPAKPVNPANLSAPDLSAAEQVAAEQVGAPRADWRAPAVAAWEARAAGEGKRRSGRWRGRGLGRKSG